MITIFVKPFLRQKNIITPIKNIFNLSKRLMSKSINDNNDNNDHAITNSERLSFLREKKLFDKDDSIQEIMFKFICNPDSAPKKSKDMYRACQQRLDRILNKTGDTLVLKEQKFPEDVQKFSTFVSIVPSWKSISSFVFHRDHPDVEDKPDVLVQRAQLSGLCYIHGPDLLQHYLVSMTSSVPVGMIDMSKLIRQTFTAEQLEQHIFYHGGGSSHSMLEYILMKGSESFVSKNHAYNLRRFGPGLVSAFRVHPEFTEITKFSYSGKPKGDFIRLHAMVLIGHREDSNGKDIFLLQNWWKEKQFIEVNSK